MIGAMADEAVPASVEMSMLSSRSPSPMIRLVITPPTVPIDDMFDQVALVVERCGEVGLARKCCEGGQEIEVVVDSFATMTVNPVAGRGAAREEEHGQGHGSDCPDLPIRSS